MYEGIAVRRIKGAAQKTLAQAGLTFPLALFLLVLALALLGILALSEACLPGAREMLPPWGDAGLIFLSWGLGFALLFPLGLGVKRMIYQALDQGRADFGIAFFYVQSKKRYAYALKRALGALLRLTLEGVLLYGVAFLGNAVSADLVMSERPALALLVLAISILFCVLTVITFCLWRADGFLTDLILSRETSLTPRQAVAISAAKMKTGRRLLRRLRLSFIPLWLLSFLLLGIPLLFVLPYYLVSRAHLAQAILND